MWLLWSLFVVGVNAQTLRLHHHPVSLFSHPTSILSDHLILRRASHPPPLHIEAILGARTYLVPSNTTTLLESDTYAPYEPIYKYSPKSANDTSGTVTLFSGINVWTPPSDCSFKLVSVQRYSVNCTETTLATLALSPSILRVSPRPFIQSHTIRTGNVLMNETVLFSNTSLSSLSYSNPYAFFYGNGTGQRAVWSDNSLDVYHCAFYDPNGAVPYGSIQPGAHSKILGVIGTDTPMTAGHGSSTSGVGAGQECPAVNQSGGAPGATFVFYAIADPSNPDSLILPETFFSVLASFHQTYGVNAHSASWGSDSDPGVYDELCADTDTLSYQNPTLANIFSAGNDPNSPTFSPGCAKNVLSVGAVFYDIRAQTFFSSTGYLPDGRRSPLVSAPGWNVIAPMSLQFPSPNHADYLYFSGTSASAPNITAMVLLLQDVYTERLGHTPRFPLIRASLLGHAVAPTIVLDENMLPVDDPPVITTYGTPILNRPYQLFGIEDITLTESMNTQTAQSVCIQLKPRIHPASILVVDWLDVPVAAGTNHTLVNDLDVLFITSSFVETGNNHVSSFEYMPLPDLWNTTEDPIFVRILVFSYENLTTDGPVIASLYADFYTNESTVLDECGSCFPGSILACDDGSFQTCLLNGSYSTCLPSSSVVSGDEACHASHATVAWQVGDACIVQTCETGYERVNDSTCACVSDSFLHEGCEDALLYRTCLPDGTYQTCEQASTSIATFPPTFDTWVSDTSSACAKSTLHIRILSYLSALLLFIHN